MTARGYEADTALRELREIARRIDLKYARSRLVSGVNVTFDGSESGLSAADVQAAIDELEALMATVGLSFIIDGGGAAITTGVKGYVHIPFACTITAVRLLADQSGSIVVDIWKDTYANYPPVDADSITASAVPTISSATKSQDTTLTGWTTAIAAGDILGFNVDSIATCQRVTVALTLRKS